MTRLDKYPGFWISLFTFGIVRALWIKDTNRRLAQGGAGFLFAWVLMPFAHFGVCSRINTALAQAGSSHRESPFLCWLFTGVPLIGAKRRLRRAAEALNNAYAVRAQAALVMHQAAPVLPPAPEAPPAAV